MYRHFRSFLVAGIATFTLCARDTGEPWHLGSHLTYANDSLRKATNKSLGIGLSLGFDHQLGHESIGLRPSLAITWLPGETRADGSKVSLTNIQGASDLLLPTGIENLNLTAGISLNLWRYIGRPSVTGSAPFGLSGNRAPGSLKFGFRLGLDARITRQWSAEILLQMVEFGRPYTSKTANGDCINPSWIQGGVRYHF